jgi:hypothetical protein
MSNARNLSKFKPSSSGLVETADIADDAITTAKVDPAQTDITSVGTLSGLTTSGAVDVQGNELILDADNDTSITADTDDQIDIKIGGTDTAIVTADTVKIRSDNGALVFRRTTSETDIAKIQYVHGNPSLDIGGDGNITIQDGDLVIGTAGHGIDFSAVTNAGTMTSELLDAYEEGTWTPTYRTADGASITVNTYNRQHGRYTRIGRNVFCRFSIGTTSVTFNNGQVDHNSNHRVQMDGLPFTSSNDSINGGGCSGVFSSMGSVTTGVGFLINNDSTIISLRNMGDTGSYNGNFVDDIYTAQMRNHSSGEGNMLTGQFFYQTE